MFCWIPKLWKLFTLSMYRGSVDRPAFRFLREPPKAGRSRATVKLNLEGLTERILPSASAPALLGDFSVGESPSMQQVAAITSQTVYTMNEWGQLIARAQQEVLGAWKALGQEIAQEMFSVQQQWNSLLGIIPNGQDQSLGDALLLPGSRSSSISALSAVMDSTASNPNIKSLASGVGASPYINITYPDNASITCPFTAEGTYRPLDYNDEIHCVLIFDSGGQLPGVITINGNNWSAYFGYDIAGANDVILQAYMTDSNGMTIAIDARTLNIE